MTFSSEELTNTSISLFDTLGRTVKVIELNNVNVGVNYQTLDVSDVQEGIYLCRLTSGANTKTIQVVIQ